MVERIEIAEMPIKTEPMSLEAFLALPPFPGHRDPGRAKTAAAKHLHKFVVEHLEVALAEYQTTCGKTAMCRLTGNTRAAVWAGGLSDKVPSHVWASIFSYDSEQEVREAGLRFDSPEAAWKPRDFAFRAAGMTFKDEWRPLSKEVKSTRLSRVVRLADAFLHGHYNPEKGTAHAIELVMPAWAEEIKKLDAACEVPLVIENGNFSSGVMAACLLLFRFEPQPQVEDFIRAGRSDNGTKDEFGMDGAMQLSEVIKMRGVRQKGQRVTRLNDNDDAKKVLTAFDCYRKDLRLMRLSTRIDPVVYCRQRGQSRPRVVA